MKLDLRRACFIGDNLNDLSAFERVGLAIAANPKDERVANAADRVIEGGIPAFWPPNRSSRRRSV